MALTPYENDRRRAVLMFVSGLAAGAAAASAQWLSAHLVVRLLDPERVGLPAWLMRPEVWVALTAAWLLGGLVIAHIVLTVMHRRMPPLSTPTDRLAYQLARGMRLADGTPRLVVGPWDGPGGLAMVLLTSSALVSALLSLEQVPTLWILVGEQAWRPVPPTLLLILVAGVLSSVLPGVNDRQTTFMCLLLPPFAIWVSRLTTDYWRGPDADLPGAHILMLLSSAATIVVVLRTVLDTRRHGPQPSGFEQLVLTDRNVQVLGGVARRDGKIGQRITVTERGQPLTFARAGRTVLVTPGERGRRVLLDAAEAEVLRAAALSDGWAVVEAEGCHALCRAGLAGRLRAVVALAMVLVVASSAGRALGAAVVLNRVVIPAFSDACYGRLTELPSAVRAAATAWPSDAVVQAAVGMTCEAMGDGEQALPYWRAAGRYAAADSKIAGAVRARLAPGGMAPFLGKPGRGYRDR